MMMLRRTLVAFVALVALGACSSEAATAPPTDPNSGEGESTGDLEELLTSGKPVRIQARASCLTLVFRPKTAGDFDCSPYAVQSRYTCASQIPQHPNRAAIADIKLALCGDATNQDLRLSTVTGKCAVGRDGAGNTLYKTVSLGNVLKFAAPVGGRQYAISGIGRASSSSSYEHGVGASDVRDANRCNISERFGWTYKRAPNGGVQIMGPRREPDGCLTFDPDDRVYMSTCAGPESESHLFQVWSITNP